MTSSFRPAVASGDHAAIEGHLADDGPIVELRVMIRPLSGLIPLAQAMGARLEDDPVAS